MPPTEAAQRNHDALFPRHVSTLARTDPELIEYFDNFAFDEVLRVGNDRARLIAVLTQLIPFIGYPRALSGLRVVDEVTTA